MAQSLVLLSAASHTRPARIDRSVTGQAPRALRQKACDIAFDRRLWSRLITNAGSVRLTPPLHADNILPVRTRQGYYHATHPCFRGRCHPMPRERASAWTGGVDGQHETPLLWYDAPQRRPNECVDPILASTDKNNNDTSIQMDHPPPLTKHSIRRARPRANMTLRRRRGRGRGRRQRWSATSSR